jgi:hypothetical protein
MHRHLLIRVCLATILWSPSLCAQERRAKEKPTPDVIGQAAGITVLREEFDGGGPVLKSIPAEDMDGSGWQTSDAKIAPRRENGQLVSGGEGGVAGIMLPPLSPHGEVTITASLNVRTGPALVLGFTEAVRHPKDGSTGPLLRITGDGRLQVQQDADTRVGEAVIPRVPKKPVTLVILYRCWDKTLSVAAGGKEILRGVLPNAPAVPHRCFTVAYEADEAKAGPALDAVQIDYVPVARPAPMIPHKTVTVQDTTLAGIAKAIAAANTMSGPDNIIEVSIPKGDYRFLDADGAKDAQVFLALGLKHLIINWNNSTITIGNPDRGLFSLSHGKHVTVRNIAGIDYPTDNLPFTQGTVRAMNDAARTFDLEIDEGHPLPTNDFFARALKGGQNWGQLIDPARPGARAPGAAMEYFIKDIQPLQGRLFRFVADRQLYGFRVGGRYAHCPRAGNEIFRIFGAEDIRLENITGHSCANFWSMIYTSSISYYNVKVLVKPGRLMSVNGDIATGNQNKVWIEDCWFEGNADDVCHQNQGRGTFITNTVLRNTRRFGVWFNSSEFGVVKECQFDSLGKYPVCGMKDPENQNAVPFSSRSMLISRNSFQNLRDDAIFLNWTYTQNHPSPEWNAYWRIVGNTSTAPISIANANAVRCVGNADPDGRPAQIEVEHNRCKDVVVLPLGR